jgi:hypothetical protein
LAYAHDACWSIQPHLVVFSEAAWPQRLVVTGVKCIALFIFFHRTRPGLELKMEIQGQKKAIPGWFLKNRQSKI